MVLVVVGGLALRSMFGARSTAGGDPGASHPCHPQPCANPHDFELYLAQQPAQAGDHQLLRLSARFVDAHNDMTSVNGNKNRADLLDFQLRDGHGSQVRPVFDAPACGRWDSYEIPYPQSFGPRPICFRVAGPAPLTVVWGPDLGFFFDDVRIPLPDAWRPSG
jgi:hypothetical protein